MLFIVNDFNCPSFLQYGQFLTMYWLKIKIINMLSCSVLRACQVVGKRSRHKRSRVKYVTPRLTAFHILQHPQLLLVHTQLLLEFLVFPLMDLEVLFGSILVPKEENLRQEGLYCL